jgi:tetratricopeptide (TPR) repeat protein
MSMRVMGIGPVGTLWAAGVLDAREPIVLADFGTRTVESTLVFTVTDAFRVDLSQSPTLKVAERSYLNDVLRRMGRDPGAPLDFEMAREVAVREGLKAVIAGEINAVGSGFVLSTRLVAAETGEELVADREAADDPDAIIPAIDRLSRRLRERIGESLKTVRQTPRLARVRTGSLEALKRFTEGNRANNRGDFQRCVTLQTDAIALDSLFGYAYQLRGACYGNMGGHRAQQVADYRKAFELRDRMTDFGRAQTTDLYYQRVTRETQRGIEALEAYLDLHPDAYDLLNNLSLGYSLLGQYDRAEEVIRGRFDSGLRPTNLHWSNLTSFQLNQGKFEEAEETLRRWEDAVPDSWQRLRRRFELAFLRGDYEAAEANVRQWREEQRGSSHRSNTSRRLGALALMKGRFAQAESHSRDDMEASEAWGSVSSYHLGARALAYGHLWVRRDTARAQETIDAALARYPLECIELLDRPYADFAFAWAVTDRPARAKALLQELRDSIPEDMWGRFEQEARDARGWIAVAEGRLEDASLEFQLLDGPQQWDVRRAFALGLVYDRMEEPDSAIASDERFLVTPYNNRWVWDPRWLPLVLERLGQLYEDRGDPAKAAEYYGRFVELWAEADPELQPRVEAARRALERLQAQAADSVGSA